MVKAGRGLVECLVGSKDVNGSVAVHDLRFLLAAFHFDLSHFRTKPERRAPSRRIEKVT
jgi:hypothetical protein